MWGGGVGFMLRCFWITRKYILWSFANINKNLQPFVLDNIGYLIKITFKFWHSSAVSSHNIIALVRIVAIFLSRNARPQPTQNQLSVSPNSSKTLKITKQHLGGIQKPSITSPQWYCCRWSPKCPVKDSFDGAIDKRKQLKYHWQRRSPQLYASF